MNNTVLITGASSGLGKEFAKIFAKKGYNLVLTARNLSALEEVKAEISNEFSVNIMVKALDLANDKAPLELKSFCEDNEIMVDILVNNAGFGDFGEFYLSDYDKFSDIIEVNIKALTRITRLFLPDMISLKQGKILNVASLGGFEPGPLMAVYYASKAYVLSFSEALSRELKGKGVTITALCPGPTKTNFEKAANLGMSGLFVNLKVADAYQVAMFGVKKLFKGKVVAVPGFYNKLAVIGVKLAPRAMVRNMVYHIQKSRVDKKS